MKIARVTPYLSDRYLFVEVETDTGLVGAGESGAWGHLEASKAAIEKYAAYLIGQDPAPIELHWHRMHRFGHFRGAAICGAISAIDVALWDIKGQALGAPIHALLGGPTRTRARVYCHVKAATREEMVARCLARRDEGYTAIGHLNPFLDEGRDALYHKSYAQKIGDAVAVVAELRAALGPQIDLCIEIHRRLGPAEAIAFAREIAPFRPLFIEDPVPPSSAEAMGRVADRIDIPLATGERFVSLYEFQAHILRGALSYARVSVGLCGGLTGARKIAALAEAFDVQVIPHNPLSPVALAACLHLDAAIPNFAIQEYPTANPGYDGNGALNGSEALRGARLVDHAPRAEAGYVGIPCGPGLGVALTDAGRSAPALARPVRMRGHLDGFVVDQ